MINGNIEQFLDTGWFSEATLFYNGCIYWCEAQSELNTNVTTFFIDKWRAENEDNICYHSLLEPDGTLIWKRIFEISDSNLDRIKQRFLEAPVFEGKTLWQVQNDIAWLDEGHPIIQPNPVNVDLENL